MKAPTTAFTRIVQAGTAVFGLLLGQMAVAQSDTALDHRNARVRAAIALQEEVTPGLMASAAVLGTAVGVDDADQPNLVVYVDRNHGGMSAVIHSLPPQLRGVGVKVEATEKFRALKGPPVNDAAGSLVNHKAKQTDTILLGTSGGWGKDLANGYCCGGTLGSLVQDAKGVKYILSNYHVLEADTVPGGNNTVAASGDAIIQPGLIDVNCDMASAQTVASLVQVKSLPGSNVDCSIAQVTSDKVSSTGAILEIGTISATTRKPALTLAVKKSGRTTALTRSRISGLNATIRVAYDNECAGGAAFTKTFTGQIVITNRGSSFLNGGDSGSLLVEDVITNPKAVGLLYAGSSTSAIANPIDEVLKFLGGKLDSTVTMVGQ